MQMQDEVETIIVGGGPAGAACAAALVEAGRDVMVLDRADFPRDKLCAGWITEKVMADLGFTPASYPHGILPLDIRAHLPRLPFGLPFSAMPGVNYSIRRVEFDAWLLKRSGAETRRHAVKEIVRRAGGFAIDGRFGCRNLIGAGGTMCPVRRAFFRARAKKRQVVTLEREFDYPARGDLCRLYFFHRGIRGYGWIVPKAGGAVNVGIGGAAGWFRRAERSIHDHLRLFLQDLARQGLLDAETVAGFRARGHPYYLYSGRRAKRAEGCWLIGDAAGLASVDLGEGIGPAVESGLMAAHEILGGPEYDPAAVTRYSTAGLVQKAAARFLG